MTVNAIYNIGGRYRIIFDMGEGHFINTFATPSEYEYSIDLTLPNGNIKVVAPIGREFSHWVLKDENGNIINDNATLISNTQVGNVKLVAAYNNLSYSITWNLGTNGETWATDYVVFTSYTYSEELILPVASNIIASQRKELDYWIIKKNGIVIDNHATRIISGIYGNVEIVAR